MSSQRGHFPKQKTSQVIETCEVFCFKNPNRLWLARAISGLIGECTCYYILQLKCNLNETLEFDKRKSVNLIN